MCRKTDLSVCCGWRVVAQQCSIGKGIDEPSSAPASSPAPALRADVCQQGPHVRITAGTVVTLVAPEQRRQMDAIGAELGIDIGRQPAPAAEAPADAEGRRRALDDLFNLY